MKIEDEFSHIESQAKRHRLRCKRDKKCSRCGGIQSKQLSIRLLKLEHDVYELKLLLILRNS